MTSRDVIHSFFVPEFRIKQDVLPGRYTETWFEATKPGRYRIFCAEYCGTWHSQMRGEVVVMEPGDFDDWMADQQQGLAERVDTSGGAERPGGLPRRPGRARQAARGGAGLPQVPLGRRHAAHRSHLAGPVPPPRDA